MRDAAADVARATGALFDQCPEEAVAAAEALEVGEGLRVALQQNLEMEMIVREVDPAAVATWGDIHRAYVASAPPSNYCYYCDCYRQLLPTN
jgi:hypothetical protein